MQVGLIENSADEEAMESMPKQSATPVESPLDKEVEADTQDQSGVDFTYCVCHVRLTRQDFRSHGHPMPKCKPDPVHLDCPEVTWKNMDKVLLIGPCLHNNGAIYIPALIFAALPRCGCVEQRHHAYDLLDILAHSGTCSSNTYAGRCGRSRWCWGSRRARANDVSLHRTWAAKAIKGCIITQHNNIYYSNKQQP